MPQSGFPRDQQPVHRARRRPFYFRQRQDNHAVVNRSHPVLQLSQG